MRRSEETGIPRPRTIPPLPADDALFRDPPRRPMSDWMRGQLKGMLFGGGVALAMMQPVVPDRARPSVALATVLCLGASMLVPRR